MHKKRIRNLVMINCFLLVLPSLAFAEENNSQSSDVALEEVVVTATPLEKYLVTTSVITAGDIEAKGAKNLSEALEDIPGLNFNRGKKNANTVDIRGSNLSYTKIYIDGVFVNPLAKVNGADSVDLDMFPVGNIAKIEIIKGPAPVSYGTDAIGGIILITTKNGKHYEGGNVSISAGSNNTRNGSFSYGGNKDKFSYFFNAGIEHTDGFVDNADRKSNYFNTKLSWNLNSDDALTFTGGYSHTDKGALNAIDPINGHVISSKNGFWPGLNNWEFRDWEKTNLSLDYAKKVSRKLDYDVKVYRFTEKQAMWANGANYDPSSGLTLTNGVYPGSTGKDTGFSTNRWNASPWESTLNGVEIQSNYKISSEHTLSYGALYNGINWKSSASVDPVHDPYDPNNLYWKNYKNSRYGYYVQDQFIPNDKTTVTLGIRHDENEVVNIDNTSIKGSKTSPTVNVVYQADKRNTIRGSFGETSSFPLINQLYGTYGNANLKPEEGKNYELGLKHQFDKTLTGDLAIFKNDITNRIDTDPVTKIYYNLTSATIKGMELELQQKLSSRWNSFINYTYLDTSSVKNNGTVTELTYTPKNHINYGFNYRADKGYRFNLIGHWVDARYTDDTGTGDTRTKVNGVTPIYKTIPSYHVIDFQIKRQINDKQDWYITINNIFDKQYEDRLFYPAAGRSVLWGTDYKF